ncbi:hypothetical protein Lfu02_42860 [Longispora fulva]|uniref:Glyoxalase-like domain-containing protein n=1 Tax=Longispora fulva TaxID=619741 RepID=A0A8J7KJB6_9ACTN|nr:VOC family protein [Longispora fulva]MBG6136744.1 hypothetical protein [Longispora fulva]GIG59914.1 hypothetical protein Lfu02_42860 [Longispora fulva]
MATSFKICVDCADPHLLASFWAAALDYEIEDHAPLIRQLLDAGAVGPDDVTEVDGRLAFRAAAAIRDPAVPAPAVGQGGRVLFQVVPEPKSAKNRMHLDLHVPDQAATVARLVELGATVTGHGEEGGRGWTVMADPEGNEFCVANAV